MPSNHKYNIDDMKAACEAMVLWFDAENAPLNESNTFQARVELCQYVEWAARKALGQDVPDEYQCVPSIVFSFNN